MFKADGFLIGASNPTIQTMINNMQLSENWDVWYDAVYQLAKIGINIRYHTYTLGIDNT